MDWQSLAILGLGLCPASLFVGFVGALILIRQLGVRWPWEQAAYEGGNPGLPVVQPSRPRVGDTFTLYRVPNELVGKRVAEMAAYGWRFLRQDRADSTNLFDLQFVWLGE